MNGKPRRLRLLAIVSALGLGSALGLAAAPVGAAAIARHASAPIPASTRIAPRITPHTTLGFVFNYNSGLCLGISGGARDAPAVQWNCLSGHPDQQWHTGGTNSAGYYQIVNGDGECLGTSGGGTANGTRVVGWSCLGTGHPDQYWLYDGNITCNTNYSPIFNYKSGRVLGVSGNSTAVGAAVVIFDYQGVCNNQFWAHTG